MVDIPWKSKPAMNLMVLNWKDLLILVQMNNQHFRGTILLLVFDLQVDMFVWWYLLLQRLKKMICWGFRVFGTRAWLYIWKNSCEISTKLKTHNRDIPLLQSWLNPYRPVRVGYTSPILKNHLSGCKWLVSKWLVFVPKTWGCGTLPNGLFFMAYEWGLLTNY